MCVHTLTSINACAIYRAELILVVLPLQAELDVFFSPSATLFNQLSSGILRTELAGMAERPVVSHDERHVVRAQTLLTEVRACPLAHMVV